MIKKHCIALLVICFVSAAQSQSIDVEPVSTIADYNISMPGDIADATVGARWSFDKSNTGIGQTIFDGLSASYALCKAGTKPIEVMNGVTCVPRFIDESSTFRTIAPAETIPDFNSIIGIEIQDYFITGNTPSIQAETFSSTLDSITTNFQFNMPETDEIGVASVVWKQTRPNSLDLGNGIELKKSKPIKVVAKVICDPPKSNKNCEIVLYPVGNEGPQPDAFKIEVLWTPDQFEGGFPKLQFKIAE